MAHWVLATPVTKLNHAIGSTSKRHFIHHTTRVRLPELSCKHNTFSFFPVALSDTKHTEKNGIILFNVVMPQEHSRGESAAESQIQSSRLEFVLNKSCQPWLELQVLVGASAARQKAGEQP